MPSFFSQAPIDYGARYIAQAGSDIAGQIGQYSAQVAQQKAQEDRMKQQAAIEEQQRQTELQRQLQQQAATYNVQPITGHDGKFDPYATQAAVSKAKLLQDRVQRQAELGDDMTARGNFATDADQARLGLGKYAPQSNAMPQMGDQPAVDPRREVYLADQKAKNDEYEKQRKMTADSELARQRSVADARELDTFRSTFGREPLGNEVDPASGRLTATALGAIQTARTNSIKGFTSDPADPNALVPIPGGPADLKIQADKAKADAAKAADVAKEQALAESRKNVLENVDVAIPQVGRTTAGVLGGSLSGFYQPSRDLHANLDAIKSGLGVDKLNEMRASSANGSTGIGRIMQVEFDAFSKAARNLDQKQSPDQLRANLEAIKQHLTNWQAAHEAALGGATGPTKQPGAPGSDLPPSAPAQPGTIKIRSIKQVSP